MESDCVFRLDLIFFKLKSITEYLIFQSKLKHKKSFHPGKTACLIFFHFHLHVKTCYFLSLQYCVTSNCI